MNLERVTAGRKVPDDINVIIEIPMNADDGVARFNRAQKRPAP